MMTELTAHPDYRAFAARIAGNTEDDLPRLVLADWLEERGDEVTARLLRAPTLEDARLYAVRLEAAGFIWISEFQDIERQIRIPNLLQDVRQSRIDRQYMLYFTHWRSWLPAGCTLLTRRANMESYCSDYGPPAIRFPSRRKHPRHHNDPWVTVGVHFGLPAWCECDDTDWSRFGVALVAIYPWMKRE